MKKKLFILFIVISSINLACTKVDVSNSNTHKSPVANINPTNMPEGLSANQVTITNDSIPGIPDPKNVNANNNIKNSNSVPRIPDTTKTGKTPMPKNTPPIPGIPDEETLKKQLNTPVSKEMMDKMPPGFDSNSSNRPIDRRKFLNNSKPKP